MAENDRKAVSTLISASPAKENGATRSEPVSTLAARVANWFRDLLSDPVRGVLLKPSSMSPAEPGWSEFLLARGARAGLVQVDFLGRSSDAALILRRSCVLMLLTALMKREGIHSSRVHFCDEDWEDAQRLPSVQALWASLTSEERSALTACLASEEAYFAELAPKERKRLGRALYLAERQLMVPFEGDERRIMARRVRRWVALGTIGCAVAALIAGTWFGIDRFQHRHNLAYKRPVRISSSFSPEFPDESAVVDGDRKHVGFHTGQETNPWVVIDLGSQQSFNRVVVYNRSDCCAERALPLVIEVSNDDVKYQRLAERLDLFEKWEAETPNARGRFLRLRLESTNMFHLNEIEVY